MTTGMTDGEMLAQLNEIFRNVFEDDTIQVTAATTSADIAGWDSMSNITMVVEAEHVFGVKFKAAEMESLQNVGDLMALLRARLPSAAA